MFGQIPSFDELKDVILLQNNASSPISSSAPPIGMRMRSIYYLRQLYMNYQKDDNIEMQHTIIDILSEGINIKDHGSLLRHEIAYVLGQLRDDYSCPILEQVLTNTSDCIMVRHECAEALGAIGSELSRPALQQIIQNEFENEQVQETCQLAINVMDWRQTKNNNDDNDKEQSLPAACACMLNPYSSVDPAPPHPSHASLPISKLKQDLCDESLPLFERYRIMFSLRNMAGSSQSNTNSNIKSDNTDENNNVTAIQALGQALVQDTSSALFRHEIAYVLGQVQHPSSIPYLERALRKYDEHVMVRHEAAEALGAIDDPNHWEYVESLLQEFSKLSSSPSTTPNGDKTIDQVVVAQSCIVALDAADYWGHATTNTTNNDCTTDNDDSIETKNESFTHQKNHAPSFDGNEQRIQVLQHHFNVQMEAK